MINNGKAALVAAALITMMSCTQKNETQADNGYIGPSDIKIEDGRMTPEALLSLGRLSDPQLSPDGHWILYGVSYTSIEENRSCRNLFLGEVIKNDDGSLSFGDKIQLTAEATPAGVWTESPSTTFRAVSFTMPPSLSLTERPHSQQRSSLAM